MAEFPNIKKREEFHQERFRHGMGIAISMAILTFIFSVVFLIFGSDQSVYHIRKTGAKEGTCKSIVCMHSHVMYFLANPNYRSIQLDIAKGSEDKLEYLAQFTQASEAPICTDEDCDFGSILTFFRTRFVESVKDIVDPAQGRDVLWYFRLITLVEASIIFWCYQRKWLVERHHIDQNPIRETIFTHIAVDSLGIKIIRLFILGFLIYILTSAGGALLDNMFKGIEVAPGMLIFVGIAYAFFLGNLLVHFFSGLNTYDLLISGLVTIAIGFGWAFFTAHPEWYRNSISNTGTHQNTGLVFTLTMVTMSGGLAVVWREITVLLRILLKKVKQYYPLVRETETFDFTYFNRWDKLMYVSFILLALIGVIPTVDAQFADWLPIKMNVIHKLVAFAGPMLLVFAGMWGIVRVTQHLFPERFTNFSYSLLVVNVAIGIWFIGWMVGLYGDRSDSIITGFELWMLTTVGVWFYGIVMVILDILDGIESEPKRGIAFEVKERKQDTKRRDEKQNQDAEAENGKQNQDEDYNCPFSICCWVNRLQEYAYSTFTSLISYLLGLLGKKPKTQAEPEAATKE